jgi:hypothetical protein
MGIWKYYYCIGILEIILQYGKFGNSITVWRIGNTITVCGLGNTITV